MNTERLVIALSLAASVLLVIFSYAWMLVLFPFTTTVFGMAFLFGMLTLAFYYGNDKG